MWNSEDFNTSYDAIICTDVLEHIPTKYISSVLKNLHDNTNKICYLAIALFPDKFGNKILGKPLHLTVKKPNWWVDKIIHSGFKVIKKSLDRDDSGKDIWLHVFLTP